MKAQKDPCPSSKKIGDKGNEATSQNGDDSLSCGAKHFMQVTIKTL